MFFSGRVFDAAEARALGLVSRVVAPADLDDAVEAEIAPYLAAAPGGGGGREAAGAQARAAHRRAVIEATIARLADAWETPEAREGIAAFLEKRRPPWAPSAARRRRAPAAPRAATALPISSTPAGSGTGATAPPGRQRVATGREIA